MADSKIEDLSELTSVASADVLPIVDDTSGTPVTKKITKANLVTNIAHTDLTATGTKDSTTFLRGDNTWATNDTNATHTGEVTGSGALTITDNVVDEANLKVSNAPTNGYVLTARSGNTGGMTWEAAAGSDTPWTEHHDFDTYYFDMQTQTAPADPSANNARIYLKAIDSNNDGLFMKIKKNGSVVEVQIA